MTTELAAIFIIVAHFTVMGYGGDALPEGRHRLAYADEAECKRALPTVKRSLARSGMPATPDWVACQKLEIRRTP